MGRQTTIGPQRPQVSAAELRKRLNPEISIPRKRKRKLTKALSSKSRNYRQHPTKRPTKRRQMDKPLQPPLDPIQPRVTRSTFRKTVLQGIEESSSENEEGSRLSSSEADTNRIDTRSDSCISDSSLD